jgi:hypothetical protein
LAKKLILVSKFIYPENLCPSFQKQCDEKFVVISRTAPTQKKSDQFGTAESQNHRGNQTHYSGNTGSSLAGTELRSRQV